MVTQTANATRLRIESGSGSPINDYRIREGLVEMRSLDPPHHWASDWRTLNRNELELHNALGTVVSKWLQIRLGSRDDMSAEG
jgi:hypothetical protein